jgi:hypothetical protein
MSAATTEGGFNAPTITRNGGISFNVSILLANPDSGHQSPSKLHHSKRYCIPVIATSAIHETKS